MYPFGLHNSAVVISDYMAWWMHQLPTDDEFMGMADWVTESIYDLLEADSDTL